VHCIEMHSNVNFMSSDAGYAM